MIDSQRDGMMEDRNRPETLMRRAAMWLRLIADAADIEPTETSIEVTLAVQPAGDRVYVTTVTLAEDIAALEAAGGEAPLKSLADFDEVRHDR